MPKLVKGAARRLADKAVPVVTRVRNEFNLLAEFVDHYRSIGVSQFHIIDNGSTDGTREYFLDQPDAALYDEPGDFSASRSGMDWIDNVLHHVALERWAIYADVDEHLVCPGMERTGIEEYAWRLGEQGYDSCRALLIDMYHDGKVDDHAVLSGHGGLYGRFPYFDTDYVIRREPKKPWVDRRRQRVQFIGGPRYRIVSDIEKEKSRGWVDMFLAGQIDRFINYTPEMMLRPLFKMWPYYRLALHKRPLNLIHSKTRFGTSHDTNNQKISPTLLGLLHFRFCAELRRCFENDALKTLYYRRGLEREQLRLGLLAWPHETLMYEGSRKYQAPRDLIEAGLIGDQYAHIIQK